MADTGFVGTQLLLNGRVYAEAAPRAGALLVAGDTIAWVGATDTARTLDADTVVDLQGALVTPAFVDAYVDVDGIAIRDGYDRATVLAQAASLGVACLQDVSTGGDGVFPATAPTAPPAPTPAPTGSAQVPTASPIVIVIPRPGSATRRPDYAATVRAGGQPFLAVDGPADVVAAAYSLEATARSVGADRLIAATPRIEGLVRAPGAAALTYERLAGCGAVVVTPGGSIRRRGATSRTRAEGTDLAGLASAGVPLALGSWQGTTTEDPPETGGAASGYHRSPWSTVWAAANRRTARSDSSSDGPNEGDREGDGEVDGAGDGVSVRAAFRAHTVGGWRAARRTGVGRLEPGAPATYAVWQAGAVVVAAPDGRIQRWSTDPRSAVPGLPDLSLQEGPPRCLRTVVGGMVIYDDFGGL